MNKIDKALQLCTSKNDSRVWMHTPFSIGEKVYSTNGFMLCIAPKTETHYDPPKNYKPENVLAIIPKYKDPILSLTRDEIKHITEICPKVDGYDITGENRDCECCEGHGTVDYEFDYKSQTYYEEADCPICDGSGLAEKEKKVANGKQVPDLTSVLKIGASDFLYSAVTTLFEICEIMQSDALLISQEGEMKPSVFRIGEIELMVMPCFGDDDSKIFYRKSV